MKAYPYYDNYTSSELWNAAISIPIKYTGQELIDAFVIEFDETHTAFRQIEKMEIRVICQPGLCITQFLNFMNIQTHPVMACLPGKLRSGLNRISFSFLCLAIHWANVVLQS